MFERARQQLHDRYAARRVLFEGLETRRLLAAEVVIHEIMYHQASDNTDEEFIELYNVGDADADLLDWRIDAGVDFQFPQVTLPAGGHLVIAADVAAFRAMHPQVPHVVGNWTGRLANRGEGIRVLNAAGEQVDYVRYADQGAWATRVLGLPDQGHRGWRWEAIHDGGGASLELVNPRLDNQLGHNWQASTVAGGTPGAPNSVASGDAAPLLAELTHTPAIPRSTDAVTIAVHMVDKQPASVAGSIFYRRDGESSFHELPLTPDATTQLHTATIPPMPNGEIVEYYVMATDTAGNVRIVPDFTSDDPERTAHHLYQVLDNAPSPEHWDAELQPVTYLVMQASSQRELADIGDGPLLEAQSNAQMNATWIRVDGNGVEVRHNVGVRNRGGASRVGPPNNHRINFRHDETMQGVTSLNLNSRFPHAQILGSAIFRLAGMPAAEAIPMRVQLNGMAAAPPREPFVLGSYAQLEVITGQFPDNNFPQDRRGNLYRVIEAGTETGDLRFEGNDPLAYQDTYSKRTNEEADDWSDLIELVEVLNNVPEQDFAAAVERVLDVDQWLRFLALDSLLGNLETGLNSGRGDNFWLYRGTEDTRFRIIPHDLDTILGVGRVGQPRRSIFSYTATPGLSRFLTHDAFVPRYYQAFEQLIEQVYNPRTLFPLIDQLAEFVNAEERSQMKQFVVERIAGVEAQIPDEFTVTTRLPIVNGFARTIVPRVELIGTADAIKTRSVVVNGQLADWSPFAREWSLGIESAADSVTLIAAGAVWSYLDDGSQQFGSWRQLPFDTRGWRSGPSPLGYGDGDEATRVGFGPNPNDKFITTYFRHEFQVTDAAEIQDLLLKLERDDGALVYLNGSEIVRSNLPPGPIDHHTVASQWVGGGLEGQSLSFAVDPALLVEGVNVIAIEVHQATAIDDDLRLDVSLQATRGTTSGGVPLKPGINRVHVQAFDEPDGQGSIVAEGSVDVWYDGAIIDDPRCDHLHDFGTPAPAVLRGGDLPGDTVLAACGPAYRITGEVVVPAGVTLTILPGTTLFFEQQAGIRVRGGQLMAEGLPHQQIRFTRAPEVTGSWNGIQLLDSPHDNRIGHAILEYVSSRDGLLGLESSRLEVHNATLDHADLFRIVTKNSSLVVRDSTFTDMFAEDEPPATDNASEHIKGSGILPGGQFLLEGNWFGRTTGHNDAVDFDGAALPDAIPTIVDNVFTGSGDDILDLEADAYIEGNAFFNVRRDPFNQSTGDANAISAGGGGTYYVFRNTFHNVDHAVQVKDEAFLIFDHNTVDTAHISPIYFDLPDRTPGKGAFVSSSIFSRTPTTLAAADQAQQIAVTNSIVTPDALQFGNDNLVADPRLRDPSRGDFALFPGSPASQRGFAGMDLGGSVPAAPWIQNAPPTNTAQTSATLHVRGPGLNQYRFRINGGPWSDIFGQEQPIRLQDLASGTYHVEVIGRNLAGVWDDEQESRSVTWTVDTSRSPLIISEVLASNSSIEVDAGTPDLIELRNEGPVAADLSGMALTDDLLGTDLYIFPPQSIIPAGGYLVVRASERVDRELHTGFRLNAAGDAVYLLDTVAKGREVVDHVEFGIQVADLSISQNSHGQWTLSEPTLGRENRQLATGDINSLRINEWLAKSDSHFRGDFLELYNQDDVPVDLSGLWLTDDLVANPQRHQIAPLSFIGGRGFVTLVPNGDPLRAADQLPFGLQADGEVVSLLEPHGTPIDQVIFLSQTSDVSQGRAPDGASDLTYGLGTPGHANSVSTTTVIELVEYTDVWRYHDVGGAPGIGWQTANFDDSNWSSGAGLLGVSLDSPAIPIATSLRTGIITHYFRHAFDLDPQAVDLDKATLTLSTIVDDGVVLYVNGNEVLRRGLPTGPVTPETTANRGIGLAAVESVKIPTEVLLPGRNWIAAEVHQVSRTSADVVFGASLSASTTILDAASERSLALLEGLRISELMYHPDGAKDAEYIEFANISHVPLDVSGVTVRGGINFEFPAIELSPGEHVVASPDTAVFVQTYGDAPRLIGEYDGHLSNGGEQLSLHLPSPFNGPLDATVLDFEYADGWHEVTDGDGYSLEIVDLRMPQSAWRRASSWRPSSARGGTPGRSRAVETPGDFDADGQLTPRDLDQLRDAIAAPAADQVFDLNHDGQVDLLDQTTWIRDVRGTREGDIDLDGRVDFRDFLTLAENFGRRVTSWGEGDLDADGEVRFADFLLLAQAFGFIAE